MEARKRSSEKITNFFSKKSKQSENDQNLQSGSGDNVDWCSLTNRDMKFSLVRVLSSGSILLIHKSDTFNPNGLNFSHGSGSKSRNNEFVSTPFCSWKNARGASRGALNRHSVSLMHQQCVEQAAGFRGVEEKRADSIKSQLSEAYDKQVQTNTAALLAIVDSILFLVKQGLGLRGSNWDRASKREDGNFSCLLHFVSKYSPELQSHIIHSPKNARYLSPKIQNEFIAINGEIIRRSIVDECNSSNFWSIMADETTDVSTKEQVSVCARYIRKTHQRGLEVCEEFLGFSSVAVANAETITSSIVSLVEGSGLIMDHLVGKGFDGASTMSGHVSGIWCIC